MRTGIIEQQERAHRRAVAAVRKKGADREAISNPMTAVRSNDFGNFSDDSLLSDCS